MADKKISQLPAITPPIASTDLLPVVQGSVTKKITVNELIPGLGTFTGPASNVKGLVWYDGTAFANDATVTNLGYDTATNTFQAKYAYINSGLLTVDNSIAGFPTLGTASGAFRITATANAFGLFAGLDGGTGQSWLQGMRTDGAVAYDIRLQPVGGNVRIGAGNLVFETSGKGIDFSATPGTGTSELLADYEEGTWTPSLFGCGPSVTVTNANYVKVGNQVTARATFNSGVFVAGSSIFTLPFASIQLTSGTFVSVTATGGFLEAQNSTLCYFATSITGTVSITITYITS